MVYLQCRLLEVMPRGHHRRRTPALDGDAMVLTDALLT
jgi:hypothetical protein